MKKGFRTLACGHTIWNPGDMKRYMGVLIKHVMGCDEAKRIMRQAKEAGLLGRTEEGRTEGES